MYPFRLITLFKQKGKGCHDDGLSRCLGQKGERCIIAEIPGSTTVFVADSFYCISLVVVEG